MRKIEKQVLGAFLSGSTGALSVRDRVAVDSVSVKYYLWDHLVFEKEGNKIYFSFCGWQSNTTKSRINALLFHFLGWSVYQKNYSLFVSGSGAKDIQIYSDKKYKIEGNKIIEVSYF